MPERTVTEVLAEHSAALLAVPGVVGTAEGVCEGAPCIRVYVEEATSILRARVPEVLEGYPVVIEETGEIQPLDPPGE